MLSQQFHQLPMFMSAREIRTDYQALDGDRDDRVAHDWDASPEVHRPETDDELFGRKADEAWGDYDHSPNTHLSLGEHILRHGVENPVSLMDPAAPKWDMGSQGKPQILGGHHRVAVMEQEKPTALMPVEHFTSVKEAKRSLGKKY